LPPAYISIPHHSNLASHQAVPRGTKLT
jgi:hypothetical protein